MRRVIGYASAVASLLLFPFVLRAAFPTVATNSWSPAQPLTAARSGAATVLLQDGRLLIMGGNNGTNSIASVDLVDTAGNVTAGPPMNMARSQHTATVLQDGRVLVVGGVDVSGNPVGTAEIFDPSANPAQTNPWTSTGPLVEARSGHTATLLHDGTVLIAGGFSGSQVLNTLELFNAASGANGSFTVVPGTLSSPRAKHAAALLEDGRVLIAGGWDGTTIPPQPPATTGTPRTLASTDIYDPSAQQVRAGPALNVARMSLSATTQLDGQVFIAGGNDGTQDLASTETFDPTTSPQPSNFTLGKLSLTTPRSDHLAILLPHNGGTLLVGGSSNGTAIASAELYMPVYLSQNETATLTAVPNAMGSARALASGSPLSDGSATSVNDGLLLVAGGTDASGKALSSAEYFGFAWVKTDALEYAPGTPVNISGGGFQPGETVTLHLQEFPYYDSPADMTAVVKGDGTFANSTFAPDTNDLNTGFFLTATGSASGYQAQTMFADNVQVNGATITVENAACTAGQTLFTQGDSVCANVAVTTNGNGASTTLYVVWFNPTSTLVASDAKVVSGNTAVTDTLPTTGSSPTGTWTVKTCDANNCSTANGNKIWDSKTFTVREATTTALSLTSGSSPSIYGDPLTFTATVTSAAGTPTGNISFYDGGSCAAPGTLLSGPTALSSGKASFSVSNLSAAASPHTILACYAGTATGFGPSGLSLAQVVNTKALTAQGTLSVPSSRIYDGTTGATISGSAGLLTAETIGTGTGTDGKPFTGDAVSLASTAPTSATYNSKDVGTANSVTFNGLSLTGAASGNYRLTAPTQAATITAKALTYSGLTVATSKVYDATTNAVVTGTATLQAAETAGAGTTSDGKPYSVDGVSLTGTPTGTYNSKDVATANTVTFGGNSLTGSGSGNYTLTTATQAATITPKALTYSGVTAPSSRIYDGTTTAAVTGTATLQSAEAPGGSTSDGKPYTGDAVSLSGTPSGTYNSKDVATAATVTFGGESLAGAAAGDYTLTASTQPATITAKALSYTGLSAAASKIYDGGTTAAVTGTAVLQTAEAAGQGSASDGKPYSVDSVSLSGTATGTYDTKDVLTATTVTFGGLSLAGTGNGNYSLAAATQSATITPKALTYSGLSVASSKVYDGTTDAAVSGTAALLPPEAAATGTTSDGKPYSVDSVSLSGTATGTYNSKDVASASTVTFAGLSLAGTGNTNYSLTAATQAATITAKALTYTGLSTGASKTYDATTTATVTGTATLQTPEAAGGSTSDGKPYTVDAVSLTGTATGTYNSKDVGSATTVTFGGLSLTGNGSTNYTLTAATQSATITPKSLTLTGLSASNKPYDGTTSAALTGTAALQPAETPGSGSSADGAPYSGDAVSLTGTPSGTFATKNAANSISVNVTGFALGGVQMSDYSLTSLTLSANITPATLTAAIIGSPTKTYDATTSAALTSSNFSLTGLVGTENFTVTQTVGAYNSPDVATATTITASLSAANFTPAANTVASNYSLPTTASGPGLITAVTVTASIVGNPTKPYDGNANATLSTSNFKLAGLVGSESFTINQTAGTYNSANVATANSVTATLAPGNFIAGPGTMAGNYNLPVSATGPGSITAATLTASIIGNPTKKYDGTTTATLTPSNFSLTGLVGSEGFTVNQTVGAYNSANVAAATTVTASLSPSNFTAGAGTTASNYTLPASASGAGTILKADPTVSVTAYSLTYDGNAHTATGTVTGVGNSTLAGLDLTGTTHTNAGTFSDTWTFTDTTGNYNNATGTISDVIAKANATFSVNGYNVTYDGNSHLATGSAAGVKSEPLSGLDLSATNHIAAGTYSDTWSFKDVTGNYNDGTGTVADAIAKANANITVTPYSVTYDGNAHTATGSATGVKGEALSGLDVSATTRTNAGSTTDKWTFTDATGNYNNANGTVLDVINKADATINVTPYSVTYDGNAHTATGSATGVTGEALSGLDLSATTRTNAGSTTDKWNFTDVTGNYNNASGTILDVIAKANASISVTAYNVTYDGNPHTATGSAAGVKTESLSGLDLSGTTRTAAGTTTDTWTFTDTTGNYNNTSGTVSDSIAKANATISVTPYDVTYDGNPHTATGSVTGVRSEPLSGLDLSGTTRTAAGTTTDTWTFTDTTGNYNNTSGTVSDSIAKANAIISVTPYNVTYDGTAHTAQGTATGVKGEALSGLDVSTTTHTNAGSTSDSWTFSDGTGNYNSATGSVLDVISKANATISVTGYSTTYDATAHTATGSAKGIGGAALSGLDLSATTHTSAGTFSDTWTFTDTTGNYNNSTGTVADAIAQADAVVKVTGYNITYDGSAHTATATVSGVNNVAVSGILLSGTTHTNAGSYNDSWTFTDPAGNYKTQSGTVQDVIGKATPTVKVTPYSVTYDGNAHSATGTATGVTGETLSGLDLSGTTHTNAGTYTDSWTFTDVTGNYISTSGNGTVPDAIGKATPAITVTPYTVVFDGSPHTATGTATGVKGESLSGLNLTGTTHTNPGAYTDNWAFTDVTGNYNNGSGTVKDTINYGFLGLEAPYAPPPTTFNVQRTMPIAWQYTNAAGAVVNSASANPTIQITGPYTCGQADNANDITVNSAGASGYQYNSTTNTWQFNWQVKGNLPGCYNIYVVNGLTGQVTGPYPIDVTSH